MVSLPTVQSSNALIDSSLGAGLVAVFAGGTNGIGETTLRQFAKHTIKPRIYFIGRSQEAGDRITAELKALNPEGQYQFIQKDTSLIRNVDEVCKYIKEKEAWVNLLVLSTGTLVRDTETSENLNVAASLIHYSRHRFALNLLPLLQAAPSLRRVVSVAVATKEGPVDTTDFQCRNSTQGLLALRGHAASQITLSLEALAKKAPDVSFVHGFPGPVKSGIGRGTTGLAMALMKGVFLVLGLFMSMPLVEVGERHLWLCTSAVYPARVGGKDGIPAPKGIEVAKGTDGESGSGVYTVDKHGDSAGQQVVELLGKLRKEGVDELVWRDVESEFKRITGVDAI
ncbi:Uncharacterized protein BP5553_09249 [Venustampulla echinocandica]|uniref:NAD(P)-binding protein n=1 Tax=Venustampulla echinocandica TaxID=2656787 RepID=A0A370TC68_9HELO|nr:Uncharacterized protein BP5553_09249 [Venustampulla echinocandica]RDL31847.1 Uncharacterized protein BP5553_09249 [Venustampulla echinocandica]